MTVLGQEGLLERWFAAHEVEQLVASRLAHDRGDRPGDAQPKDMVVGTDVADAGQSGEGPDRHVARETELDAVMGQVA